MSDFRLQPWPGAIAITTLLEFCSWLGIINIGGVHDDHYTKTIVSVTEANQNFSRVTRIAEKNGQAVIFKNNKPKYMLVDLDVSPMIDMTDDEKIDVVAARILKKYKPAFMELAK